MLAITFYAVAIAAAITVGTIRHRQLTEGVGLSPRRSMQVEDIWELKPETIRPDWDSLGAKKRRAA
jgi:hypothetical protein